MSNELGNFSLAALVILTGCGEADPSPPLPEPVHNGFELVTADTWKGVQALECTPARVDACGVNGCNQGKPVIRVRWEPNGSYQRCDESGCDSYQPDVSYSGIWTEIALPKNGMMAKLNSDGQYLEVVTLNDAVLVYRGQCSRVEAR